MNNEQIKQALLKQDETVNVKTRSLGYDAFDRIALQIYNEAPKNRPLTADELSERLKMTHSTIRYRLNKLRDDKLIKETKPRRHNGYIYATHSITTKGSDMLIKMWSK